MIGIVRRSRGRTLASSRAAEAGLQDIWKGFRRFHHYQRIKTQSLPFLDVRHQNKWDC